VLNRPQLEGLTRAQTTTVTPPTVILVDSRAQAEAAAMREQAQGREAVIVGAVARDLSRGESSTLNRMIRTLQR
jgi:hypothetical protein